MIDWKRRALELANLILEYQIDSFNNEGTLVQEMAEELIELGKREGKAQKKFMEHWRCPDKKEREKLYSEYLELIK